MGETAAQPPAAKCSLELRDEQNGFLLVANLMKPTLAEIVCFLDGRLRVRTTGDYANALNGLQLENDGTVTRIAVAVDASLSTITDAVESGCNLLIVHHGLYWNSPQQMTGNRYRLFEHAIRGNLAVYSAHLPLDTGFDGNSGLLAQALAFHRDPHPQFVDWEPCFETKGVKIGWRVRLEQAVNREMLVGRLSAALGGGPVRVCPGGPELTRHIVVITGAAGSEVRSLAAEGVETLITGEGPHWTYALAEEVGVNILYGGHYATETFGVKRLAETLEKQFGLPWQYLHHPTGL